MILATWKLSPWQKIVSCRIEAMPKTKKPKETKLKRHKIDGSREKPGQEHTELNTCIFSTGTCIFSTVLEEVAKLDPQFELYPERKTFWDCLTTDHAAAIKEFVDCLCKKYSQ